MSETKPEKNKIDRVIELLKLRCDELQTYHNHKETMAHAAFLLWLAIAGFVLTTDHWPPKSVPPLFYISEKEVAFFAVGLTWLMIHWYMRWQLERRRAAAQLHGCLLTILGRWAMSDLPSTADIKLASIEKPRRSAWHIRLINFLFCSEKVKIVMDAGTSMYPEAVVNAFKRTNTEAVGGERLVTCASLLVLAFIIIVMFSRP